MKLTIFGQTFTLALQLPFSWVAFYLASASFSIATFFYSLRCPSIISEYGKFHKFYSSGGSTEELRSFHDIIWEQLYWEDDKALYRQLLISLNGPLSDEEFAAHLKASMSSEDCYTRSNLRNEFSYRLGSLSREEMGNLFFIIMRHSERIRPATRRICTIFYYLGLFLIGLVILQGFVSVFGEVADFNWRNILSAPAD